MFDNKVPSWVSVSSSLVNLLNPVQAVLRPNFAFVQTEEQISVEGKLYGKLSFIAKLDNDSVIYSIIIRGNRDYRASRAACLRLGSVFSFNSTGDVTFYSAYAKGVWGRGWLILDLCQSNSLQIKTTYKAKRTSHVWPFFMVKTSYVTSHAMGL